MSRLRRAVRGWILADYYIKRPHLVPTLSTTGLLYDAEEELREALTGHTDLVDAALSIGAKKPRKPRSDWGWRALIAKEKKGRSAKRIKFPE